MKKRIFSRVLALVMAVSLLSTTAFAASFKDLQDAINDTNGTMDNPAGYAQREDGSYGISAWTTDGTRNVQLNEDVTYAENQNPDKNKTVEIGYWGNKKGTVAIDLNGQKIDGTGSNSAVINVYYGDLILKDTSEKDDDGYTGGAVTGGKGGITLGYSTFTMFSGNIVNNKGAIHGGGVQVAKNSTFTMKGGEISNNVANNNGGGVYVTGDTSKFVMENGAISNNKAGASGGGVYATSKAGAEVFKMTAGTISKNTGSTGGGIYLSNGNALMESGTIDGNTATNGGGVSVGTEGAVFTMENGSIINNTASATGGGVRITRGTFNFNGGSISGNTAESGGAVHVESNMEKFGKFNQTGGSMSNNTANNGEGMYIAQNTEFVAGGLTYTLSYEAGEKITLEDGTTKTLYTVTVSVKDAEGKPMNSTVTMIPMLKSDAKFAVDPTNPTFTVPAGSTVSNYPNAGDEDYVTARGGWLDKDGVFHENPVPVDPDEGDENPSDTTPGDATLVPDGVDTAADTTTIEDEETPLAGLVSIAQLLEELRQYEGIEDVELPEDFQWSDHDYAQAIYWGLNEALVVDTEDDPLDPDEIVTVAMYREVLENFAAYKGLTDFVAAVEGEDDDIVFDLGERLTVFYGELEAALEALAA